MITTTLRVNKFNGMKKMKEKIIPFELMETKHGKIIVNKFDELSPFWGVGSQIMRRGYYDMAEMDLTKEILNQSRSFFGDGVIAIDCGANIGVHTIEWAQLMCDWGHVYSFEAQEPIYYSLCGTIILNGCFNVTAKNIALGDSNSEIGIPKLNYYKNSSFGSLEIKKRPNNEWIGQEIDYSDTYNVKLRTIDSFKFERVDLMKIDVEGMEEEVFRGSLETIKKYNPVIFFEHSKSNKMELENILKDFEYNIQCMGNNELAIHKDSPIKINMNDYDLLA